MGAPEPRPIVYFDGQCRFCRAAARTIGALDRSDQLDLRPAPAGLDLCAADGRSSADVLLLALPEGRVLAGADAIIELADHLRGGRILRLVARLPGARTVLGRAYDLVARHRRRLG